MAVLVGEDYADRDRLLQEFEEEQKKISASAENPWEQVSIAFGIAVYDPVLDQSLKDLISRADQRMYENKRARNEERKDD